MTTAQGHTLQRLIVQYTLSDGCTYCTTYTEPALGESPQAYLEALEALWMQRVLECQELRKQIQALERQAHPIASELSHLSNQATPNSGSGRASKAQLEIAQKNALKAKKAAEELSPKYYALQDQISALREKRSALENIVLGHCRFTLEDLSDWPNGHDKEPEFNTPTVMTVDEYFAAVEVQAAQNS